MLTGPHQASPILFPARLGPPLPTLFPPSLLLPLAYSRLTDSHCQETLPLPLTPPPMEETVPAAAARIRPLLPLCRLQQRTAALISGYKVG